MTGAMSGMIVLTVLLLEAQSAHSVPVQFPGLPQEFRFGSKHKYHSYKLLRLLNFTIDNPT